MFSVNIAGFAIEECYARTTAYELVKIVKGQVDKGTVVSLTEHAFECKRSCGIAVNPIRCNCPVVHTVTV